MLSLTSHQVSFMAFLGPFNAAVVNPSLVTLAKDFHKTTTVISYSTSVSIIMGGVSVSFPSLPAPRRFANRL